MAGQVTEQAMVKQRYLALDALRGLTLAMMILVNTPGSWSHVYWPLLHAPWHGVTPTDFVFPFFLFVVGSAMFFSFRSYQRSSREIPVVKIVRRTLLLFVIGLLLHAYPFTHSLSELRIPGVLQRIALAYGAAAFLCFLAFPFRLLASAFLLAGYWVLFIAMGSDYSLEGNPVRQLDLWVFGEAHLWHGKGVAFDPEGLLSTLPAVVNVLLGFEITRLLVDSGDSKRRLWIVAVTLVAAGMVWHSWMPLNKYLWTSSFVLLTSGAAAALLMTFVYLEKSPRVAAVFHGLAIYGKNPLLIYILAWLWAATLYRIPVGEINAYQALYTQFTVMSPPRVASLCFALLHVVFFWWLAWLLHRRGITVSL